MYNCGLEVSTHMHRMSRLHQHPLCLILLISGMYSVPPDSAMLQPHAVSMLPDVAGFPCVRTHYPMHVIQPSGLQLTGPSGEIQAMRAFCCSQGCPQLSESSQPAVVVSGIHHVALTQCMLHVTL